MNNHNNNSVYKSQLIIQRRFQRKYNIKTDAFSFFYQLVSFLFNRSQSLILSLLLPLYCLSFFFPFFLPFFFVLSVSFNSFFLYYCRSQTFSTFVFIFPPPPLFYLFPFLPPFLLGGHIITYFYYHRLFYFVFLHCAYLVCLLLRTPQKIYQKK